MRGFNRLSGAAQTLQDGELSIFWLPINDRKLLRSFEKVVSILLLYEKLRQDGFDLTDGG